MLKKLLFMSLLLSVGGAFAAADEPKQPKPVFGERATPADFPQLIQMIRVEIEPGGRWEEVPSSDRPMLETKLKEMESLLANHESVDELSDDEKMKLLNAQGHVNALLLQHDDQRLVCERYTPTGSHRPRRLCMTVAQRRENSEKSRAYLESQQRIALPVKQ